MAACATKKAYNVLTDSSYPITETRFFNKVCKAYFFLLAVRRHALWMVGFANSMVFFKRRNSISSSKCCTFCSFSKDIDPITRLGSLSELSFAYNS